MAVTEDQVYSLLIRQRKLELKIDELCRAINGSDVRLMDVICSYGPYSDKAIRAFVNEALLAYSFYTEAHYHLDPIDLTVSSKRELLNPVDWSEEEIEELLGRGPMSYLDKDQKVFLENLLYCMVRLVAESPFYDGMYAELVQDCRDMVGMLKRGPSLEEFAEGVARRQQRQGVRSAIDARGFMDRRSPFTVTYSMFPLVAWSAPGPWPEGAFIPDLDSIYELLGGKPIDALVTKAQLRDAAKRLSEAATVEQAGEVGEQEAELDDSIRQLARDQEEFRAREAKSIAKWAEGFPRRDAWCKAYATMCRAYFKLGGLKPIQEGLDWDAWTDAVEITPEQLDYAFQLVLDDCGLSHFTDSVFEALYDNLSAATVRARRSIMQRRRKNDPMA